MFEDQWRIPDILWVEDDARRRGIVPCHEFGFLVGVYFPASLL